MKYSDAELIEKIRTGGKEIHHVMNFIYADTGYKNQFFEFIQKYGANEQDAEDAFQDAIIHLIVNIQNQRYQYKSSLKTYLFSIGKYIWFNKLKKDKPANAYVKTLSTDHNIEPSQEEIFIYHESLETLNNVLSQIGETCKIILSLWSLRYSMKEIAHALNHKSEGFIRKKKHSCMQSLIELIKNKPELMDQIHDI
jgi:RNA polymerase sigma factor (sigma-70 family)